MPPSQHKAQTLTKHTKHTHAQAQAFRLTQSSPVLHPLPPPAALNTTPNNNHNNVCAEVNNDSPGPLFGSAASHSGIGFSLVLSGLGLASSDAGRLMLSPARSALGCVQHRQAYNWTYPIKVFTFIVCACLRLCVCLCVCVCACMCMCVLLGCLQCKKDRV